MPHADFVHLHVHSAYSLSEGALKIPELVALCQQHRMPAVGIADSGNLTFTNVTTDDSVDDNGMFIDHSINGNVTFTDVTTNSNYQEGIQFTTGEIGAVTFNNVTANYNGESGNQDGILFENVINGPVSFTDVTAFRNYGEGIHFTGPINGNLSFTDVTTNCNGDSDLAGCGGGGTGNGGGIRRLPNPCR